MNPDEKEILPKENEGVQIIIGCERIETGHGKMEEVSGVDGRTGKVPPNGLEQVLIPLPRHCGLHGHGPGSFRGPIHRRSSLGPNRIRGKQQASKGHEDNRTNGHITI